MTKSRDNKQAIRAYMRTHGVNYTTAKRALRTLAAIRLAGHIEQEADANIVLGLILSVEDAVDNIDAATSATSDTDTDEPVILDMTRARKADLYALPHIHDLNGRCAKNRHGNFCPPLAAEVPDDATIPEGVAVRRWQATALDHTTGNRVPAVITEIRHPADDNGLIKVTTHTEHNVTLDTAQPITGALNGGLGTGEPVTPSEADRLRTNAHATSPEASTDAAPTATPAGPPALGQFCDTHFSWLCQAGQGKCGPTSVRTALDEPGATARIIVGIDPSTNADSDTGTGTVILHRADGHPADNDPAVDWAARLDRSQRIFDGALALTREHAGPTDPGGSLAVDEAWAVINRDHAGPADPTAGTTIDLNAPTPARRDDLKAALRTGNRDVLNAHLRAHAPGPDPSDIQAVIEVLAADELALREHTSDPETPVTYEMLRHAILATSTHGETWGDGFGYPTAADVCRSYLLGIKVTTGPETPDVDGQYPVAPEDLAAILEDLADDDMVLDEACEGSAVTADDLAEELLILANTLDGTLPTKPSTKTGASHSGDDHHYLVVHHPTTTRRRGRFTIDCTTPTALTGKHHGSCEGWEECPQCAFLGADAWDAILDTGEAHGVEHIMLTNGPAIATGKCSLIAFPEAWEESDAILNLPPGRYAINHQWEDEYCTLWLRTR